MSEALLCKSRSLSSNPKNPHVMANLSRLLVRLVLSRAEAACSTLLSFLMGRSLCGLPPLSQTPEG